VLVQVKRSWRTFANNAPMQQVPERKRFEWQVFARLCRRWADGTECSERGAQLILRAKR
jgi:hypothetical protein